jgi:DeoR/GlpR family transcriptional regulator of sugar metabolism
VAQLLNETRQDTVYDLIRKHGGVRVSELEKWLQVSDMTIRRDLEDLAKKGLVRRVHGGAVLVEGVHTERSFVTRAVEELNRKMAIARLAVRFLKGNETLYIDCSTTCNELAKRLSNDMELKIVTNSVAILLDLQNRKNLEITLLGGTLEKDGNSLGGPLTQENAEKLAVDCCFFSAGGFTTDIITNPGMIGATVKKTMIRNAAKVFLLADSTKFNQRGFIELCRWRDVDALVTDSVLTQRDLKPIADQGVEVHIAPLGKDDPRK